MTRRENPLWVTGLGLITPLGLGVEATWARLVRGERAFRPVTRFDCTGQRVALAACVEGVESPPGKAPSGWSRASAMALAAAREAIQMACLDGGAQRTGLVVGCTTGGMVETEVLLAAMHADPALRKAWPELIVHPLTSIGDRLEETLGRFSRVRTVSSACSSGATAVVVAAGWLLHGEVDAVVVVGTEALSRLTLAGFNALAAIDSQACRPFARGRRGTTLGEGAGCLVIEGASRARARGARPIAELSGWAMGSEAHHITNPDPGGALVGGLIGRALWRAGLSASDVDYVNAHGTATPANDAMEAAALANALGGEINRIPVSSSKGQIGHTLGAAGAIEAAITALVVARRTLVPTAGLDEPDPALRLVHVPNVGREVPAVRAALSNAFGFGGMAAVLVFQPPNRSAPATPRPASEVVVTGGASCERTGPRSAAEVVVTGGAAYGTMGLKGARECADLPSAAPWVHAPVNPDSFLEVGRARRLESSCPAGHRGSAACPAGCRVGAAKRGRRPQHGVWRRRRLRGVHAWRACARPPLGQPGGVSESGPGSPIGHASMPWGCKGLRSPSRILRRGVIAPSFRLSRFRFPQSPVPWCPESQPSASSGTRASSARIPLPCCAI